MLSLQLASVSYGGYISVVKFAIMVISFFVWLPLVGWVFIDASKVRTKANFWSAVVFAAGAAALMLWLILPVFFAGMVLFGIGVAATFLSYVRHRNSLVAEFEQVLTPEHIKSLFVSQKKQIQALEDLIFFDSENEEAPLPEINTPEFLGYKAAYDLFLDTTWRRVSDIAFLPTQQDFSVQYYIDGAGHRQPPLDRDQMEHLGDFLKTLAGLDSREKRKPQRGTFLIKKGTQNIEWQVQTAGSTAGEHIKLKLVAKGKIERLTELGLAAEQLEQLNRLRDVQKGLFIVSGPKGSGVTTMFYALLRNHDPYLNSIHTLERQPTAELVDITQNLFTLSDTGTGSYGKRLLAIARSEPDIIGAADCNNAETAKVACRAVRDGKLLYVTLEAENVIQALAKWIKLVGDKNLAAATLLGISNQRLLRKLCDKCKQAYEPNKQLLRKFNIPPEKAKVLYRAAEPEQTKRGKSKLCENCQGTGFVGRTCIFETIMLNSPLRKSIAQSKSMAEITTEFRRAKMLYLQEQAMKKVVEGTTAINEMVRILSSKKDTQQQGKSTQ